MPISSYPDGVRSGSRAAGRPRALGAAVAIAVGIAAWAIADALSVVLPAEWGWTDRADVLPGMPFGLPGATLIALPAIAVLAWWLSRRVIEAPSLRLRFVLAASAAFVVVANLSVTLALLVLSVAYALLTTPADVLPATASLGLSLVLVPLFGMAIYGLPSLLVVIPATLLWASTTRALWRRQQTAPRMSSFAVVTAAVVGVLALRLAFGLALPTNSVVLTIIAEPSEQRSISWQEYAATHDALWDALEAAGISDFAVSQSGDTDTDDGVRFDVAVAPGDFHAATDAVAMMDAPLRARVAEVHRSPRHLLAEW